MWRSQNHSGAMGQQLVERWTFASASLKSVENDRDPVFLTPPASGSLHMPLQIAQDSVPARILVVEDDPVTQSYLLQCLTRWGLPAHSTSDLTDGLTWLAAGNPCNAILIDQHLPDANCEAIALAMRQQNNVPRQHIVAMTAGLDVRVQQALFDLGYAAVVGKPISTAALSRCLRDCGVHWPLWGTRNEQSAGAQHASLYAPLRDLLKRDLPKQINTLCASIQAHDTHTARALLHTMSGAASLCMATALDVAICELSAALQEDIQPNPQLPAALTLLLTEAEKLLLDTT